MGYWRGIVTQSDFWVLGSALYWRLMWCIDSASVSTSGTVRASITVLVAMYAPVSFLGTGSGFAGGLLIVPAR